MSLEDKNIESVDMEQKQVVKPRKDPIYCHFSFKRPRGTDYGIFSAAFYFDFDGKKHILHKVRKYKLWQDHQFITAIQSYEHALLTIYENQGMMRDAGVREVMLVTDNSTLAGWIENPKKNKNYSAWMEKAVKMFRTGAPKEIVVGVGLCEPRHSEKSYKYCKEENVSNSYVSKPEEKQSNKGFKFEFGDGGYKSVFDLLQENAESVAQASIPTINGMETLDE